MGKKKGISLFNAIAPMYGLFYDYQKSQFQRIIDGAKNEMDIVSFHSVLDVGCGTGALCSVLKDKGMDVTGIDPASKMLNIARGKPENTGISFIQANALERLPFEDNSFDVAISSYVAHGLEADERKQMYAEMSRVARHYVIVYDYNDKRSLMTSIIEWLEGGDYFHFIKHAEPEMRDCVVEMKTCFSEVRAINVDVRAKWYICHSGKP